MKLSLECGKLPASLFLQGVDCSYREAFTVGGFADIFRGTYNYEEVGLKRLRVFQAIEKSRRQALEKVLSCSLIILFIAIDVNRSASFRISSESQSCGKV